MYLQTMYFVQSATVVEYTDYFSAGGWVRPSPKQCPGYDTKKSDRGSLGTVEYSLIAIAPRTTLARSGSI